MTETLPKKTCTTLADGARICETRQLGGDQGIHQTLYIMRDLARRDARDERVISIAREHQGADKTETAYNLWRYMVENFPYKSDPDDHEFVSAPIHTLSEEFIDEYPYRDCDDLTTAYASLLKAVGIPSYMKAIAWRKDDYTHVYNLVGIDGGFIPVDLVMQRDGFGAEKQPQIRSIHIKV